MADRRIVLDAADARLVQLAQAVSGLAEARAQMFALCAPLFAKHGVTEARIESEGEGVVLVVPASAGAVAGGESAADGEPPSTRPSPTTWCSLRSETCGTSAACIARGRCLEREGE